MPWTRDEMAEIAAGEIRDGEYVNLGIGIPTLVANHIPKGISITLQSENGLLGMGEFPYEGEEDAEQPALTDEPAGDRVRIHISRGQAAAFCEHADDVVAAGRPTCLFCGRPVNVDGHACPRMN